MVESSTFEPDRLLLHASLITTVVIGLVTVLTFFFKWTGERAREKARKANQERAQQWLSKRGLSGFPAVSDRNSFTRLLEQRVKNDKEWNVSFTNVTASPAALSVSLLGVLDEGQQLLVWLDVMRSKEKLVELQVTATHPTLGRMGCSLSVQSLHLRFKAVLVAEEDGVYLTTQFLTSPEVTFRITKKHPITITHSTLDSLTECLQSELTSLMLQNVPLLQSTPADKSIGDNHSNGAVEGNSPSDRPSSLPHRATQQISEEGCVPSNVEIIVQTATPSVIKGTTLEEEPESTASEDAAGSGNGDKESGPDHPTPSHSSSSPPSTPGSQWRRSQSYEKLDFTDVMPPPPPPRVTTPNRAFKHSTSMVASRQNGSLLEEMGRRLDSPTKTPKKRPTSAVLHPGSAGSVSGTTSESDAWSVVTESSEDLSVNSASDVSMIVYEFKDSRGSPKHIVVDKASKPHIKRPPHSLKLHIYNGHTFVATHFKRFKNSVGPLTCSSCKKRVHGVVGKQAYQCRGCKMIVHKGCHSLVAVTCPQSTVESMNLIYMGSQNTI